MLNAPPLAVSKDEIELHTGGRENIDTASKIWMLVDEQSLEMVNKWTLHDNIHKLE